jgi:hypothetical protein
VYYSPESGIKQSNFGRGDWYETTEHRPNHSMCVPGLCEFRVRGRHPLAPFDRQVGSLRSQATLLRIGSPESRIGRDPVLCRKAERGPYHDGY